MSRPLRGAYHQHDGSPRYIAGASASLCHIIANDLPYFSFQEAINFYAAVGSRLSNNELALLGCNDRYFLLTGLLNRPDMLHPWRYDRCREVETNPDGYLDLWFREAGKSTIITFTGVIQEVVVDPEITIGIFSNTKDISRPFLSQIKQELESNDLLKEVYADVLWSSPQERKAAGVSWSVEGGITVKRKSNPKEATIEAHGLIDAMPTGRHFGLQVFNDVITEKNVTSPEQIKKSIERFELADNLGKSEGSRKWYEGTRYSFADAYGTMLESGIAIPRIYPATDDGTLNGKPVLLSQEAWERKKKAQRSQISAQMLQNPIAGNENTFRTKWLKPYWVRPIMMNVYILGDPSKGRSKTSDRTALAVIGIDSAGNKYLLDGYCHKMPLSERWNRIKELHKKWSNTPGVQLVKVGYERYGMQSDDEYFDECMRREGIRFDIEELNWTGEVGRQAKEHRVARLEPDFRNTAFFVPGRVWHGEISNREDIGSHIARWYIIEEEHDDTGKIIKEGSDEIHYRPDPGPHRQEHQARQRGELWRIFDPIMRRDEDNKLYDLTRVFFEEFRFFPFSPRDDLIDAVSRIYDMEPMPATKFETVDVDDYQDA